MLFLVGPADTGSLLVLASWRLVQAPIPVYPRMDQST